MKAVKTTHSTATARRRPRVEQPRRREVHPEDERQVEHERGDHRLGQPAPVAGADEHAVDDEDVARERLPERDDDERRRQRRPHGRVGGEAERDDLVQRPGRRARAPRRPRPPSAPSWPSRRARRRRRRRRGPGR